SWCVFAWTDVRCRCVVHGIVLQPLAVEAISDRSVLPQARAKRDARAVHTQRQKLLLAEEVSKGLAAGAGHGLAEQRVIEVRVIKPLTRGEGDETVAQRHDLRRRRRARLIRVKRLVVTG